MDTMSLLEIGGVSVAFGSVSAGIILLFALRRIFGTGKAFIDQYIEEFLENMEKEPELAARVLNPVFKYLEESGALVKMAKGVVPVIFKEIGLDSSGQMKPLKIGGLTIPAQIAGPIVQTAMDRFAGPKKAAEEVAKVVGFG